MLCALFGAPAEEQDGKLRLLHRIVAALTRSSGALALVSMLNLRMWGEKRVRARAREERA